MQVNPWASSIWNINRSPGILILESRGGPRRHTFPRLPRWLSYTAWTENHCLKQGFWSERKLYQNHMDVCLKSWPFLGYESDRWGCGPGNCVFTCSSGNSKAHFNWEPCPRPVALGEPHSDTHTHPSEICGGGVVSPAAGDGLPWSNLSSFVEAQDSSSENQVTALLSTHWTALNASLNLSKPLITHQYSDVNNLSSAHLIGTCNDHMRQRIYKP